MGLFSNSFDVLSERAVSSLRPILIGFAFGVGICLLHAQPTDAGFISVALERGSVSVALLEPADSAATSEQTTPRDRPLLEPLMELGVFFPPAHGSAGMGSGTSSSGPGAHLFALADTHECSSGQIVTYLTAQPGVQAPVPFLDSTFHPPKAVVSL